MKIFFSQPQKISSSTLTMNILNHETKLRQSTKMYICRKERDTIANILSDTLRIIHDLSALDSVILTH